MDEGSSIYALYFYKTSHNPTYDAKNRFNLPEEMDLDFKGIAHLFEDTKAPIIPKDIVEDAALPSLDEVEERQTIKALKAKIDFSEITEDELKAVVAGRGHYTKDTPIEEYSDDFITRWVIPNWKKIVEIINKNKSQKGDK